MVLVSAFIALYYNVIISVCVYYFFASMTSKLPWSTCEDFTWASCYCRDSTMNNSDPDPWNSTRMECGELRIYLANIFRILVYSFSKNVNFKLFKCTRVFHMLRWHRGDLHSSFFKLHSFFSISWPRLKISRSRLS
ncbi:hypothetical protein DPMN_185442 [Dreissena polymorpha]|uniref:Uncharacterized protein n=1 Tax=Dreissena polymorpha TaxID=45954 RepID=A0A9D4DNL1_DREPO|nr:hypothetical protein DPMN_185442 [Dreissena polymorpha]